MMQWGLIFLLGITVSGLAAPSVPKAPSELTGDAIPFRTNFPDAMRHAKVAKVPVVIYFSSPTCQWCRRMQVTSFADRTVKGVARRFVWVKVDTSRRPDIAAMYQVRGLPHTVVLDSQGKILTAKQGYMPPDLLAKFLRDALVLSTKAPVKGDKDMGAELKKAFVAAKPGEVPQALRAVVEKLAAPDAAPREGLLKSIDAVGPKVWPALCELMKDKRLAFRSAAAATLIRATKHNLAFDPFASADTRSKQIAAWLDWIKNRKTEAPTSKPATPNPPARKEPK